jgi:hypothetical protein
MTLRGGIEISVRVLSRMTLMHVKAMGRPDSALRALASGLQLIWVKRGPRPQLATRHQRTILIGGRSLAWSAGRLFKEPGSGRAGQVSIEIHTR